jgi:hypothetical protein
VVPAAEEEVVEVEAAPAQVVAVVRALKEVAVVVVRGARAQPELAQGQVAEVRSTV